MRALSACTCLSCRARRHLVGASASVFSPFTTAWLTFFNIKLFFKSGVCSCVIQSLTVSSSWPGPRRANALLAPPHEGCLHWTHSRCSAPPNRLASAEYPCHSTQATSRPTLAALVSLWSSPRPPLPCQLGHFALKLVTLPFSSDTTLQPVTSQLHNGGRSRCNHAAALGFLSGSHCRRLFPSPAFSSLSFGRYCYRRTYYSAIPPSSHPSEHDLARRNATKASSTRPLGLASPTSTPFSCCSNRRHFRRGRGR